MNYGCASGVLQPAFHRQRLAALASVMAEAARDAAAEWQPLASAGRPVDVDEEMMRLTRTVVVRALLGADLGPFTSTIDQASAGAAPLTARICCP